MSETLVLTGMAGIGLGAIFYGGLWWTVRKGVSADQPALWFFASWLLRTGIALAGFYFVGGGHVSRLLACLAGFAVSRPAVTWLTRSSADSPPRPAQEAGHAP
jgi:F1F0 ATPase subunit 2